MDNQKNISEEVFIGARALGKQIDLILPTYELLLDQIEQIRNATKTANKLLSKKENNNTIGIFGARGTGKTSVLYTIMNELKEDENSNIILPIIEPDNFGENTKIMGSVIGLLSDVVNDELEKIKENDNKEDFSEYFNNCIYKENNPLKSKRDELIEYHLYTESEYRKLLTHTYDDTATHIKKSSYLLTPDIKFKEKLSNLINSLVEIKRKKGQDVNPLIFIFIDDIDLKTTKCKELMDSILQYASHPNVVTILSGDYEILKESLTLALINGENLQRSNLKPDYYINDNDTIFERKKYLSNEYLKKIIPPARRHNVVNWNITTIPYFAFGNKTLSDQLNKLMGDKNFFGYYKHTFDKVIPIEYSYSIFDKTPRGLINVYYYIYQITKLKKEDKLNKENLFNNVKALIDTIIISSRELVNEQKYFLENCLLWGSNAESTFIDYQKIPKYIEKNLSNNQSVYSIHENLFNYFIICEMLKELVEDIGFVQKEYIDIKNFVLKVLYLDPKDKMKNKYDLEKENLLFDNITYIHNIVLPIAINTNLKSAFLLIEYLTNSKFKEDYSYKKQNYSYKKDINKYEKDSNAFIAICDLISQDTNKNLLKDLYLKSYDDNSEALKLTFQFLNDICNTTQEYAINQRIFEPLLQFVLGKFSETLIECKEDDKFRELLIKEDIEESLKLIEFIEFLLLNTFIEIQKNDKESIEQRAKKLDEKSKYLKQYKIVRKFNDPEKFTNITDRQKNNINKIIENLGIDIFHILYNYQYDFKLEISNRENFHTSKEKFTNGYSGYSGKTIYANLILDANKTNFENMIFYTNRKEDKNYVESFDYMNIYERIKELSSNYRVWYGREEAIDFLVMLKQQFYFKIDILEDKLPLIYELGIYLKNINSSIKEDIRLENYKKDMKNKLTNALQAAKDEIECELEEIGSNLEDDELSV